MSLCSILRASLCYHFGSSGSQPEQFDEPVD